MKMFDSVFVYFQNGFHFNAICFLHFFLCNNYMNNFTFNFYNTNKITEEMQKIFQDEHVVLRMSPLLHLSIRNQEGKAGMQWSATSITFQYETFKIESFTFLSYSQILFIMMTWKFEDHSHEKNHRLTLAFLLDEILKIRFYTKYHFRNTPFTFSNRVLIFHGFISQSKPNIKMCLLT